MALQERITQLELNDPTFIRRRKVQVFHMMIRSLVQGFEYTVIYPSAWPYMKSMDVDTWFYGIVLAMTPVGTIVLLPVVGWLYDRSKDTRKLHTLLNVFGVVGSLIYSMPFSPWLPLIGRLLTGARLADIPIAQGEVSWTYKTQDRLKAFSYVLVGFFLGVILSPLFTLIFDHINIYAGDFYVDYRNLPGISIALMCIMLEISNQFMIFNLAKNCVDENGRVSGNGIITRLEDKVNCEKKPNSPSYSKNANKLSFKNSLDVQVISKDTIYAKTNQGAELDAVDVVEKEIQTRRQSVELEVNAIQLDSSSAKLESQLNEDNDSIKLEDVKDNTKSIITASVKEQIKDAEDEGHLTNGGYDNDILESKLSKFRFEDDNILSNANTTDVVNIDNKEFKSVIDCKSTGDATKDITTKNCLDSNTEIEKKSNLITVLKEVCHFEIIGVTYCSIVMWIFLTEGTALLPVVSQEDFGWSILQTNVMYLIAAVMTIIVYIILARVGNKRSDTCLLFITLPIASIAPIFILLYSKAEEGAIGAKVLFCTAVLTGTLIEPCANAVIRSLLSKITPIELQGSVGSFVMIASKGGNLLGPLYATLMLEHMVTCNLISFASFAIGFLWLLLSLKRLNYRRQKYAIQTKA